MTTSRTTNTSLRRAGAVLAGLLCIVVLSTAVDAVMHSTGIFPPMGHPMSTALWWLAIGYRAILTVLGGWIAARLDPGGSMRAVWILTALGVVLGLVGVGIAASQPELGPAWYAWGVALTGPPCCWLGGLIYFRTRTHSR